MSLSPEKARSIREEAGLSQERLAALVGVSRLSVHHWERGRREPRPLQRKAWEETLARVLCDLPA